MPVVPFSPQAPKPHTQGPIEVPAAEEPWVLMAAAQMDGEGRLVESYRGEIEDRTSQGPEDIGPIVQFPGEKLPMHAVTKLGAEAGAQDLDNELVERWLKDRGK